MDILPSGGGAVSLHLPRAEEAPQPSHFHQINESPESTALHLYVHKDSPRPFFSSTYLLSALNVTSDPLQYQIQLRPIPYLVVAKLDLPFAGPTFWRPLISHPWCLARRQEEKCFTQ